MLVTRMDRFLGELYNITIPFTEKLAEKVLPIFTFGVPVYLPPDYNVLKVRVKELTDLSTMKSRIEGYGIVIKKYLMT